MAEPTTNPQADENQYAQIDAGKKVNDPGEAHRKGYSADPPGTKPSGPPPIPLQPDDDDIAPKRG